MLFLNLLVFGIVFLLYMPVILAGGLSSVIGNEYVAPVSHSYLFPGLWLSAYTTLMEWTDRLPPIVTVVLALFVLFCLRKKNYSLVLFVCVFALIGFAFIHPAIPPPRVWSFLLPLLLILSGAGASVLISIFFKKHLFQNAGLGLLMLVSVFSFSSGWNSNPYYLETADNEAVALYLKTVLKDGDKFLADLPFDYPIECYMRQHDVPVEYLRKENLNNKRILFIVNRGLKQKTNEVLARLKIDTTAYSLPAKVAEFKHSSLYEMNRKQHTAQ